MKTLNGMLGATRTRVTVVLALAALVTVFSTLVLPGTLGTFTASTNNLTNSFSAGTRTMADTAGANGVIVAMNNMEPGDSNSGTVTITNTGSLPASVVLSQSAVTHTTPGTGTGNLAHELQLTITDQGSGATVYSGPFDGLSATTLAPSSGSQWAAGEAHTYQFTVTLPSEADNSYQATTASADFNWTAAAGH